MPARTSDECDRLFGGHVNAADLEVLMALYEHTCSLVRRDGSVAIGRQAIRRSSVDVVKVVKAGEHLALVYNDWKMSAKGRDGQVMDGAGRAIEVVRLQPDGTWAFRA